MWGSMHKRDKKDQLVRGNDERSVARQCRLTMLPRLATHSHLLPQAHIFQGATTRDFSLPLPIPHLHEYTTPVLRAPATRPLQCEMVSATNPTPKNELTHARTPRANTNPKRASMFALATFLMNSEHSLTPCLPISTLSHTARDSTCTDRQ